RPFASSRNITTLVSRLCPSGTVTLQDAGGNTMRPTCAAAPSNCPADRPSRELLRRGSAMPLWPYLSRRRVLLALALLAAAGLGRAGLIAAWGKAPPSRRMYTQLQVGMTPNEVEGLLAPGCPDGPESIGAGVGPREGSRNRHLPLEVWAT